MKLSKAASRHLLSLLALTAVLFAGCRAEVSKPSAAAHKTVQLPEITPDTDFSKGILKIDQLIKESSGITREKYPNADDVLVDEYTFTSYKADGTSVTWDDSLVKILTEKGRRAQQTLSYHFTLPYSTIQLKKLAIIRQDGKIEAVDIAANSKVMINSSQMGQNIYNPNSKIMKVNVPGLKIGDMVRSLTVRRNVKTRVPDTWSDYYVLEYTSPIRHTVVEILAPADLPLAKAEVRAPVKGTVKSTILKKTDSIRYRWVVEDVPRMFPEPNMPPLYSVVQRLLVSTVKDWKFVSNWYWQLSKTHISAVTPEMRKQVEELVRGKGAPERKMEAVFQYVSQKIRYMGITTEKEAPGYEPHDASLTFKNKYGVCRDKAALLVAMLRAAGFKAYPVLIMVGPKKDPDVPNPFFNHAIACVETKPGQYILMDPTNENTRRMFPAYLCNRSYLVAKPGGDILRVSPIIPADDNMMQISTHASVSDNGIMIAETALRFNGINDGAYRGYFAARKPLERKRFFEKIIKRVFPGAKLVEYDIQPSNIRDTSQGLKVYLRYVAENTLIKGGGKIMIPPPWFGSTIGMVNFILGKTGLEKRKYPLETEIACGVRETFSIDLKNAVGSMISLPEQREIGRDTVSWYQNFRMKNKILTGNSEFMLKTVEFSPEQYLGLKKALKKIEFNKRKTPIFYDTGVTKIAGDIFSKNANTAILDETVDYKVKDSSAWEITRTVREKILTYAGKKVSSELKFSYNPAWESITVDYAKVIQKDGTVRKVSKEEINLMDAPWIAAAPRYPPSKILVINLPGVDIGSVIEYRVVRKLKNRPFFSMLEYFQGFDPVLSKKVRLTLPEKMRVRISNLDNPGDKVFRFKSGKHEYSWTASNVNALKWERNLPPYWSFMPSCAVSAGSWEQYAGMVDKALATAADKQPKTAVITEKVLKKAATPEQKIEAIRNFAAVNIKNAGPAFSEVPLSSVSPADRTLMDGYGNSADRAVLIYSMLKKAGFYPEFVLASNFPGIEQLKRIDDVPQPSIFNTVLVHIVQGKKNYYLNDTDQYASTGATYSEDRTALFCSTGMIGKVTADKDQETRTNISYTLRLADDGTAYITRKRTFFGTDYAYWHKKYSEMADEERNRHFQEMVAGISQSAVPATALKTNLSKYPGTEEFSVTVKNFAVTEGKYFYVNLPGSLRNVLGVHGDTRANPFIFGRAYRTTRSYLLNLPKEYASKIPIAPKSDSWTLPSGAGAITIVNDRDIFGNTAKPVIFINQDVDLRPAFIKQDEFEAIQLISSKISNKKTQTLMMERAKKK